MHVHPEMAAVLACVHAIYDATRASIAERDFAAADRSLHEAFGYLDGAHRFALLHRPPSHALFDPSHALRRYTAHAARSGEAMHWYGDAAQAVECVRAVRESAGLGPGGHLVTALFAERPAVAIGVDGAGAIGTRFGLVDSLSMDFDGLTAAWARATDGGMAERGEHGLTLWVDGDQTYDPGSVEYADALGPIGRAAKRMRPWRTSGGGEEGYLSDDEAAGLYGAVVDGAAADLDEALRMLRA